MEGAETDREGGGPGRGRVDGLGESRGISKMLRREERTMRRGKPWRRGRRVPGLRRSVEGFMVGGEVWKENHEESQDV